MPQPSLRTLYTVLQRLKRLEDRNGNEGGHDDEVDSESGKQGGSRFIENEAECGDDASADEQINKDDYETKEDGDFINNEEQQHDTNTSHRQCDNEGRLNEGQGLHEWEESLDAPVSGIGSYDPDAIFDSVEGREPPDFDKATSGQDDCQLGF